LWVTTTNPLETNEVLRSFVNNPNPETKPEITALQEKVVKFVLSVSSNREKDVVTISFNPRQALVLETC